MRFNTDKIQLYVIKVDNYSTFTSLEAQQDEDTYASLWIGTHLLGLAISRT